MNSSSEDKLLSIVRLLGWTPDGWKPHARGHQLRMWRGFVGDFEERRVARKGLARWVADEIRKL